MTGTPTSGTATVLFTDLVGSTELMSRLGDVAFDVLRGDHFACLRQAVAAHGGVEVKNTGDGVMATFSSAVEALAAAVAMQQAAERQVRSAGVPLAIRVGISLGEVTLEGGDVFGTPVVEAARLVAAASPGQILATAVVRAVAGSRAPTAITDIGALDIRGLPEPVPACDVAWEPAEDAPTRMPLPPLLAGVGRLFVGRDEELGRLRQLWKGVQAGEGRLVLLGGEPGVGKTRLAAELARALHDEGELVLAGRCDEDLGVPYQPFVEALRHYLSHTADPRLGRHAGELTRLVPELTQLVSALPEPLRSDPETERYRLFDAVAVWLADVSAETSVLLVLDDLQWAAKPTLLLLRHVLRSSEPVRLLVVATYRDTDIGRGHPLTEFLADLRREAAAERFSLTGLDRAAVAAFIEAAAGCPVTDEEDEAFIRAIWSETEGNPFFVAEIVRHLSESGAFEVRDGRWEMIAPVEELGIPEGVRDVVGRRLSRLSDAGNRILAVAAVAGQEFEPAVVLTAGGFAEDELLTALDEALAARLVVEIPGAVPRNRFAHALVRATLYDELSAARRVALHRKVAEAIEALHTGHLDDHLPALAHHWARASAPAAEKARAVEYATKAGDRALAQLAHDEAVVYYRQALEILTSAEGEGDAGAQLQLLVSLGEAQRRAGQAAHRETLLEAARLAQDQGDADALARAALANSRGFFSESARVDTERVAVLEAALEVVPAESAMRPGLLMALANELAWSTDQERRDRLAEEAVAAARRRADPVILGPVLAAHYSLVVPVAPSYLKEEVAELAAVAAQLGDPALGFWAAFWDSITAIVAGDAVAYDGHLEAAERLAVDLGQPLFRWMVGFARSHQSRLAGRLGPAEEAARATLDLGQAAGIPDAFRVYGGALFGIRYDQGRLEEIVDALAKGASKNALTAAHVAVAYCELGRTEEASATIEALASEGFSGLSATWVRFYGLTMTAAACAAVGDTERAAVLYDLLAPHHGLVATTSGNTTGSVDHHLGLLAGALERLDEADAHFSAAARIHEGLRAPTLLARTRLEWAQLLRRRARDGDADRARKLLDQALTTAIELGLGTVERRARVLMEVKP